MMMIKVSFKKTTGVLILGLLLILTVLSAGCVSDSKVIYYVDNQEYTQTDSLSVLLGELPPNPMKEGHTFVGWFFDYGVWNEPLTRTSIEKISQSDQIIVYAKFVKTSTFDDDSADEDISGSEYENTNKPKTSVTHYLDGYKVTQLSELSEVYFDSSTGNVYIEYNIANVQNAIIDGVSTSIVNQVEEKSTFSYHHATTERVSEHLSSIVNSTGGNIKNSGWSVGGSIGGDIKKVGINFEGGYSSSNTDYSQTTAITQKSIDKFIEEQTAYGHEITVDFRNLEPNFSYKYVLRGDCIVSQIFVYDIDNKKCEGSFFSVNPTEKPQLLLVYSTQEENFSYPATYKYEMDSIDLKLLYNGDGTENNPYKISSEAQFILIELDPTAHYRLTQNLDFTPYSYPRNMEFSGVFDGNGKTITGSSIGGYILYISDVTYQKPMYYGLFSKNSGTIKDLNLECVKISSTPQHNGEWVYVGCVAGINTGVISNIELVDCEVQCHRAGSSIGMVTGINEGTISNCRVTHGYVHGNGDGGGITGTNTGKIVSSVVVGNGGKNSDNPKDYAFLHFYRVEKSLGYNGGQTRSWGGIAGYATPTSNIDNVKVEDVFVYCQFVDESRIDNIGYLVGHNQGDITEKSGKCQVINSSEHRTGNWDRGTTLKYYFGWSDGDDSIGNNEGNSPW